MLREDEISAAATSMLRSLTEDLKQFALDHGETAATELWYCFLSTYVSSGLYGSLIAGARSAGNDVNAQHAKAKAVFAQAKGALQDVIAYSATTAVKAFTGQEVEYYCQLTAIGDPVNKLPS